MCATQDGDVLAETGTGSWIKITGTVALVVIVLDRLTKWWIESNLEPGSCERSADACIDLVGSLRLHFIENPGMAFSQGEGVGRWLGVVAIILSAVLIRLATKTTSPWRLFLLGLIIGGAIGNLIDRISRAENGFLSGSVVDFVDVQWFPIWNIADAAITCGVIGLLLLGNRDQPAKANEPSASHQTDHEPA